jgi:hypothetical protein
MADMEQPPSEPAAPDDKSGPYVEFSDHESHEPWQPRVRDEWRESIPAVYPFVEQRHGDRRHRYKQVPDERRRPEAGDRRRLPLMLPLPGFHINGEPQHDNHRSVLLGSIPSIRDRIFQDQQYEPDPLPDEYDDEADESIEDK